MFTDQKLGSKFKDQLKFNSKQIGRQNTHKEDRMYLGLGIDHLDSKLRLVAFGGSNSNWIDLDTVELFDDASKTWKLSRTLRLSEKRHNFVFLSIPSHYICL